MINTYKPEGMLFYSVQNRAIMSEGRCGLERAMAQGMILESTAMLCDEEMNLRVDLHGIEGIIPREEVCYSWNDEKVKDIAIITRVGKPVCFKVVSVYEREGKTYAVLSRRLAQIECMNNFVSTLVPGDIVESRVTHLESFGAFVDVGCGIISLLAVDCISVSRFSHPRDRLYCGMKLYTVIKSIDEEKGRIFVSLRELLGTWTENAACFSAGQTVGGIIRSVESYGVFVELTPNLAGLAEIRPDFSSDFLECGKPVAVYIKSIIQERMKIKLVLIDSYVDALPAHSLEYFVDCTSERHLSSWKYSPEDSVRVIETVFDAF